MIHENDRLDRLRAMGASLAVHAAVFAALFHAVDFTPPAAAPMQQAVSISLAAFSPAGHAAAVVEQNVEKQIPRPTVEKRVAVPVPKQAAPVVPPVQPEVKPVPRQPQPVAAAAERPAPAVQAPLPQTPEIKAPQPAPLSEASASTPSQAVTSAVSTVSPPTTPGLKREHSLLSDQSNVNATGPDATVLGLIRAMIENAVIYPAIARRLRIEGIVTLSFVLTPNGSVAKAEVLHSSGSSVLDRKALDALWELSGDFPSLESRTQLTIPIAFTLKNS